MDEPTGHFHLKLLHPMVVFNQNDAHRVRAGVLTLEGTLGMCRPQGPLFRPFFWLWRPTISSLSSARETTFRD